MLLTGTTKGITVLERNLIFFNQRSRDWTHPYPYHNEENLSSAGCGIFSLCHCAQWLTGDVQMPERWADFSCANGGRGDDGTDRPMLLKAMQEAGRLEKIGLRYDGDGLLNDHDALWANLEQGGVALTNLRVGHIVAVVDHRLVNGESQLLIMDSARDSMHPNVRNSICEVVPQSRVCAKYTNRRGVVTQEGYHYGMFWVTIEQTSDFNLLHKI